MPSDEERLGKGLVGCTYLVVWLFLVQPLWYSLMFGILQRIETETWMWVCYWIYVPASLLAGLIARVIAEFKD